jgi:hypothetical protein
MALTLNNLTLQDRQNASFLVPTSNQSVTGQIVINPNGSVLTPTDNNGNVPVDLATAISNLLDSITVYKGAGYIMIPNGTGGYTQEQVQNTFVNVPALTTDQILIAAVAGEEVHVLAIVAQAGTTATNLTFNSKGSGAGTAISPQFQNNNNTGEVLPFNEHGWFTTIVGQGLSCTTSAGSTTGILILYAVY